MLCRFFSGFVPRRTRQDLRRLLLLFTSPQESSPLELLILGAFRYLGRGLTFDDLEESTAISEEVHRNFLRKFIEVGSTILYEKWVKAPQSEEEVKEHMYEFLLAGLPGAFGSTDATHIVHELCRWNKKRAHIGFKSKHATRTYNLTANHRRRILASTPGNPGSFNGKTLILSFSYLRVHFWNIKGTVENFEIRCPPSLH